MTWRGTGLALCVVLLWTSAWCSDAVPGAQMAFERPFVWRPFPDLVLASSMRLVSDPVGGGGDPKSLPGAVVAYQVLVTNTGRGSSDADSVVIVDALDADMELFVGDLDGAGNRVVLVDGAPPAASGLVFDAGTDVSFSDDGGSSFGYTPAPGDWDPAVTHIRVAPRGSFAPSNGVDNPSFTIQYQARVR